MFTKLFASSKKARIILSVAIGLVLLFLYFKICTGDRCSIRKAVGLPEAESKLFQFPIKGHAYVQGGGYEDPGYGSGSGSIGAQHEGYMLEENFNDVECLGLNKPVEMNDFMPYKVSCNKEPEWNLPRDARVEHQAMYPHAGDGAKTVCKRAHPMDTIYHVPNEGIML